MLGEVGFSLISLSSMALWGFCSGEALPNGKSGGGGAIVSTGLAKNGSEVRFDGFLTQRQFVGNLAVTLASGHQAQHLNLAWAETRR